MAQSLYELSLFVTPKILQDASAVCPVCKKIVKRCISFDTQKCHHLFCFECHPTTKKLKGCPECKLVITEKTEFFFVPNIDKFIELQLVKCPQCSEKDDGAAGWSGPQAQLAKHMVEECGMTLVVCPLCAKEKIPRKFLDEHQQTECGERKISCSLCFHQWKVRECPSLDDHLQRICGKVIIECPNKCVDHTATTATASSSIAPQTLTYPQTLSLYSSKPTDVGELKCKDDGKMMEKEEVEQQAVVFLYDTIVSQDYFISKNDSDVVGADKDKQIVALVPKEDDKIILKIERAQLEQHLHNECPKQMVPCPLYCQACGMIERQNLTAHAADIKLYLQHMQSMHERVKTLEKSVALMSERIQENALDLLEQRVKNWNLQESPRVQYDHDGFYRPSVNAEQKMKTSLSLCPGDLFDVQLPGDSEWRLARLDSVGRVSLLEVGDNVPLNTCIVAEWKHLRKLPSSDSSYNENNRVNIFNIPRGQGWSCCSQLERNSRCP